MCGNGGNCYTTNKGINETVSCHKECLGGCFQDPETGRQGDLDQCFSCQNVYWKTADSNAHDCMPECPAGHFKVSGTQNNILLNIISGMKEEYHFGYERRCFKFKVFRKSLLTKMTFRMQNHGPDEMGIIIRVFFGFLDPNSNVFFHLTQANFVANSAKFCF